MKRLSPSLNALRSLFLVFAFVIGISVVHSQEQPQLWEGRLVPRDFVPLLAPENTVSLPFWRSVSNSIQLLDVLPENKPVKAGDCIATFAFTHHDAKDTLQQRLSKIQAQNQEKLLKLKKTIRDLEAGLDKRKIQEQTAALSLLQGKNLSEIKRKALECASRQQAFERKAQEHKLKAARENFASVERTCQTQERVWTHYFEMYEHARKRFSVFAPADGYLFYPHLENKNRKPQKGDNLPSGAHYLSVVTSDRSQLLFFLPEKELSTIKTGEKVTVFLDGREYPARIIEIGFFPQRFGDVKSDYKLPNAWEKCFIIKADLQVALPVGANSNVRVGPGAQRTSGATGRQP